MKSLSIMLKPASSLCNLRCKYCFYKDVSDRRSIPSWGLMEGETVRRILQRVAADLSPGDSIHFAFQGGEPTLAGLSYFQDFVQQAKALMPMVQISYALQTNGVLLDDKWCRFLKDNNFLVGISLDILPECHDAVRVDAQGSGTYCRVLDSIRRMKAHKVEFNVLCTLTNAIARHPQQVWKRLVQLDISYVQFTPCLGTLDSDEQSPYALTPRRFASFYTQLFSLWFADYQKGRYRSIKMIDDTINLMVFGKPTSCGMNGTCQPQLVVEADGSVYPCDFYCLDEYKLGSLQEQGFLELLGSPLVQQFIHRPHIQPELCKQCQFASFCGGNCKRMQKEICCAGNDSFCGYQAFLTQCGPALAEIARQQRIRRLQQR